jgi:hypothetical protein
METRREEPLKGESNLEQKRKKKCINFIEKASKCWHVKLKNLQETSRSPEPTDYGTN